MVCKHCEKKLGKLIVPDKWKEGSRSEDRSAENEEDGRSGVMRSIEHSRRMMKNNPMGKTCRICKVAIEPWANYCTTCAYKKGICARCGRKIQDTRFLKLSNK